MLFSQCKLIGGNAFRNGGAETVIREAPRVAALFVFDPVAQTQGRGVFELNESLMARKHCINRQLTTFCELGSILSPKNHFRGKKRHAGRNSMLSDWIGRAVNRGLTGRLGLVRLLGLMSLFCSISPFGWINL
jgi:hypothetical protein